MDTVRITDKFWMYYRDIVRDKMLPYQWGVLNDAIDITIEKERDDDSIPNQKSHAIENFKIAAGRAEGHHYGWVFQDSDVYKWLEAAAYSLQEKMDDDLMKKTEWVIDLIGDAQETDGYIGTYFTIEEPQRKFKRLSGSHELYCAGHFIEAAVAYYEAVNSKKALDIACRLADCIDSNFGPQEGKIKGYDGHEEIEIGLMRLYQTTGEKRYLDLCLFFLKQRGENPDFFAQQREADKGNNQLIEGVEKFPPTYFQIHAPVTKQDTAEGHAVRLVYLCTAMSKVAKETGDKEIWQACRKIWRNIVDKRMYITGGIGSTVHGESFTLDYDLPNDVMYCETCASIGLVFFAYNMLMNETDGEYADILEKALYNTVLSGMALDGKHFFYVNPLEVVPEMSKKVPGKSHVKIIRPEWLGCACCPPNLARLLSSLDRYAYAKKNNQVLSVLFLNCSASFDMEKGTLTVVQETQYPWEGKVSYKLDYSGDDEVGFGIRIPAWADDHTLLLNGDKIDGITDEKGFMIIKRCFKNDVITLEIPMDVEVWRVNPLVRSDIGLLSVSRGPFVYCLEENDNGKNLQLISMEEMPEFSYEFKPDMLGGIGVIENEGFRIKADGGKLYDRVKKDSHTDTESIKMKWIPYYTWANRGENEMRVFVHERSSK